jgi:hypothetical protein
MTRTYFETEGVGRKLMTIMMVKHHPLCSRGNFMLYCMIGLMVLCLCKDTVFDMSLTA